MGPCPKGYHRIASLHELGCIWICFRSWNEENAQGADFKGLGVCLEGLGKSFPCTNSIRKRRKIEEYPTKNKVKPRKHQSQKWPWLQNHLKCWPVGDFGVLNPKLKTWQSGTQTSRLRKNLKNSSCLVFCRLLLLCFAISLFFSGCLCFNLRR